MTRVMLMTFFGEKRWQPDAEGHDPHPHESPKSMTIPMIVLAFGSVFAGGFFSIGDRFLHWLEPVTGHSHGDAPVSATTVTAATMVVLVIGVAIAWAMYGRKAVPAVAPRGSLLTRAARRDLLQDDFNHVVLVRGGEHLTRSWSTSTTPWSTASSTARPPPWAGSPAGCANCRTATPVPTRSRCSAVRRSSSPRPC